MKQKRIERVMKGMEALGLTQILVTQPESVFYLTGLFVHPGERMLAFLIGKDGCRLFANRMFALRPLAGDLPLSEFDDTDDPVALLAESLAPGKLGIDKDWPSRFTLGLMNARRDITPVVGSQPVDEARMLKDAEELAAMRLASRMNDKVTQKLMTSLIENEREMDVGRRYTDFAVGEGAAGFSFTPLVCFGVGCAEPHHATGADRLKKGDAVILDVGLEKDHYMSDMTRTVFFGSVTDEQKKVYDVVKRANAAGKAAVRPGVLLSDIDRAARKVIEDAGYGPYFLHRTGHGIGLSVHEPPDASATSNVVARPGMTFSIEPGIYLAGKFGVRVEDLVAVTEEGCEVLNALDRELVVV